MAQTAVRVWLTVLLVLGLVVSLLGVAPRDAVGTHGEEPDVDYEATYAACVAPATESAGFEDVEAGSFAEDAINCLGHYGITQGRTATTFAPTDSVLRWQMALFLARAAAAAGIVLENPATDQGFTDIGAVSDEARNAINGLAKEGIMAGVSSTAFSPNTAVTRGSMAVILDGFLTKARPGPGAFAQEVTSYGDVKTDSTAVFGDVNTVSLTTYNAIFRIYEVGVTQGIGDHQYGPERNVTRAQMAAFIMRTLAHTVARPAGVSVQAAKTSVLGRDSVELVVSVRDTAFQGLTNTAVDVFRSTTPDEAFQDDGTCDAGKVGRVSQQGRTACQVETGDERTDDNGDVTSLMLEVTDADVTLWAWTGDDNDTFDNDDTAAAQLTVEFNKAADQVLVTDSLADGQTHSKFGETVTVTLQIADEDDVPVADKGKTVIVGHSTMAADGASTSGSSTYTFDADGKIVLEYTLTDSNANATGQTASVALTLTSTSTTTHPLQDKDGMTFSTKTYNWADSASTPTALTLSARDKFKAGSDEGSGIGNSVTATLTDQYGDPIRGKSISFSSTGTTCTPARGETTCTNPGLATALARNTRRDGSANLTYNYDSEESGIEVITATYTRSAAERTVGSCLDTAEGCEEDNDLDAAINSDTVSFYWVEEPSGVPFTAAIAVKDTDNDQMVVTSGGRVMLVKYDANDQFNDLDGTPAVLADFEKPLADDADPAATYLRVDRYEEKPEDVNKFTLLDLTELQFVASQAGTGWTGLELAAAPNQSGQPMAVDNGVLVVGAPYAALDLGTPDDDSDDLAQAGKVYIYPSGTDTAAADVVTLNNPATMKINGFFGWDVDISGDTIVVGTRRDGSSGSDDVYVYVRGADNAWPAMPTATFTNGVSGNNQGFGEGVAISGDGNTIAVVAPTRPGDQTRPGGVRVYEKPNTGWATIASAGGQALLRAKGADGNGWNDARSVAISRDGSVIVSGGCNAPSSPPSNCAGRLHIYERSGSTWGTAVFDPGSDAADASARIHIDLRDSATPPAPIRLEFARNVAVSDDGTVVVASGHFHSDAGQQGRAFVFVRPDHADGWRAADVDAAGTAPYRQNPIQNMLPITSNVVLKQLTPATASRSNGDRFGYFVAIKADGSEIAVATPEADGTGSVWTFQRPSSGWDDDSAPTVLAGPYTGAQFGTFGATYDKTEGDLWSSSATSYTDDADGAVPVWKITG